MSSYDKHKLEGGCVVKGDCLEVLEDMDDDSVILGVTSPPYFDAVNYDEHVKKIRGETDRWERDTKMTYDEYKNFLKERFEELYRVTKEGGHTVVNLSPIHSDGRRVPLPFHFVSLMEDIGWVFKEDIVWEKPIAKDRRSGVFIQHPYPGYYYPSVVAEYVFVFQKEASNDNKNNIYWNRSEEEKKQNEVDLSDFQGEKSKNVWDIRPVPPNSNIHPAPFPVELPERIIKFYSYEGDTVIDIFAGSGQTLKAAEENGRRYIGIDSKEEYTDRMIERLS